jgi:ATP-dependent phosphofructokinase / diphosphate-dependent phosphofructokinase
MGVRAMDLAMEGQWGMMTGLVNGVVQPVSLTDATAELKTVPPRLYDVAEVFFG